MEIRGPRIEVAFRLLDLVVAEVATKVIRDIKEDIRLTNQTS